MKILLLCNKSPWPTKDGGAAATLCMIKSLMEFKASLTVLSFNTVKHFADSSEIPDEYKKSVELHYVDINTAVSGLKLIRNLLFSNKAYSNERFESPEFEKKLSELLKNDFDIIQLEGLALTHYLPLIRRSSRAKIVFRPHNIESRIWSQLSEEEKNPFRQYYFRVLSRRIRREEIEKINDFDGIVAITSVDLGWFTSNGLIKPSVVIQPGLETHNLKGATEFNSSSIFFIGALDWLPNIKGLRWFVKEVWPLILIAVPGVSFHVAGRNPSGDTVRFLKKFNVSFYGEVPSSSRFMCDKSVMVVPLYSGSGIRMKIIEGMSFGKCIVSTSCGAEGLDYEDKRNIFIADSKEDFANCVIDLLNNGDLIRQTGINAVGNVRKNYNILASAEKLLKFYSELTV